MMLSDFVSHWENGDYAEARDVAANIIGEYERTGFMPRERLQTLDDALLILLSTFVKATAPEVEPLQLAAP